MGRHLRGRQPHHGRQRYAEGGRTRTPHQRSRRGSTRWIARAYRRGGWAIDAAAGSDDGGVLAARGAHGRNFLLYSAPGGGRLSGASARLTLSAVIDPACGPASAPWIDNCPASAHLTGMSSSPRLGAPHLRLGVNIDHVATVRNARGGSVPDPVRAALLAIEAGADGITAPLREDRRHIRD